MKSCFPGAKCGGAWIVICGLVGLLTACSKDTGPADETLYETQFDNPIVAQRADPWVHRMNDGQYYFTATVPEFNRIELRSAYSLRELTDAPPKVIWRKHWQGPMGAHIWAPELHRIDGVWYIYFAAGSADNIWDIRLYALSNTADDPMQGEWKEEGRIQTEQDTYALDATIFAHRGQRYLIWSQKDAEDQDDASLHISIMDSPTELSGPEVLIAKPEYSWEKEGVPANLGPSVLIKHGRVFVTFSGGTTDHRAAIGLLWANADADLLNPQSWHKLPNPVFSTSAGHDRYGPGHSSFTVAADGKTDVLLYHARRYRDLRGSALTDPNRHTRARLLDWTDDGWPVFNQTVPD